jgi:hypothetical protein
MIGKPLSFAQGPGMIWHAESPCKATHSVPKVPR